MFNDKAAQFADLRDGTMQQKLTYILDDVAITDLVQRYGEATDTRDFEKLRTCDGDSIVVDHRTTIGMGRMTVSADKWCVLAARFHTQIDADQHLMVPQSILINGDAAPCHVLMHARHFYRAGNGSPNQTLMGGYESLGQPDLA